MPYGDARELQKDIERARQQGEIPDVLLLLEHPPVYTKGRRSTADELPMGEDWYRAQGIDIVDTDRGGRVTYHGPGQLVGYPIMSLKPYRDGVHVSRGVTTHGFAINVNNDLQPFEWIVPCGIDNCRMTSVARELHAQFDMERFMDIVEREIGV